MKQSLDEWIEDNEHAERFKGRVKATLESYTISYSVNEVLRIVMAFYRQEIEEQINKRRNKEMAGKLAREKAAMAWCTPETENIEMDTRLVEAFSDILEAECSQAQLGYATTGELLEEIKVRCEINGTLDYCTVGNKE